MAPLSNASALLKPGDIIMSFDNVQIASDGTVPFRTGERIAFSYLTSQRFTGEKAHVTIMREGKILELEVELCLPSSLVAPHLRGNDPSYMVVAGFVFTPLTEPYLDSEFGCEYSSDAPVKLLQVPGASPEGSKSTRSWSCSARCWRVTRRLAMRS